MTADGARPNASKGDSLAPNDHLRVTADDPVQAGVYRVVGVEDDRVTLLALTD